MNRSVLCALVAFAGLATSPARAQNPSPVLDSPVITVQGIPFYTWDEYKESPLFRDLGLRCGTNLSLPALAGVPGDCAYASTTIRAEYNPTTTISVPVVVHILQHTSGSGQISDALVQSQIDILNEDFQAIAGTNGENGTNVRFQFYLAQVDPSGNPTTGITRTTNNSWYNDNGNYWTSLAWDTNRYLNIYTNTASGALGYVPDLPQGGLVGSSSDRVVVLWSSFGRNAPIGAPFNQGRTTTHEVGHYFGLWHTFDNGCGSASNCHGSGDFICDTNQQSSPTFGCGNPSSCGSPDPKDNYMDYSDDLCMEKFTPEQANRMRCTIEHWRPSLACGEGLVTNRVGGGNNLDTAYSSSNPFVGGTLTATVNATGSGYTSVLLLGYLAPSTLPLGGGQVLLVDVTTSRVMGVPAPGPVANYSFPIPDDPMFCDITLYTQAMLIGGASGFRLTNAQDWTIGM